MRRTLFLGILRLTILPALIPLLLFLILLFIPSYRTIPNLLFLIALAALIAIALALISAYFVYNSIKTQINEIQTACTRISQGELAVRFTPARYQELNQLAVKFQEMGEKIKEKTLDLEQKKGWLTAVLNSLHDALFVLDPSGRILIANPSFQGVADTSEVEGKFYWEVIRHPQLPSILSGLTSENRSLTTEITIKDRAFLLNATLADAGERVITLSDITEIVRAAQLKRDLILNVSHELRTPLTAIKGYLETMEETVDENNRRYLEVVKRHTDRLIKIVSDLLTLSRVETPNSVLELTEVDINRIVNDVLPLFEPTIKRKGLELNLQLPKHPPKVKGDRLYLEQALINLLDNAVRYTEKGTITIAIAPINNQLHLLVQDTGIGIDKEHLPHIFERFYVVDRARSRESGGTGLGLAIVKHIAALHKGEVKVESTPGIGSKFTLILPITQ
ncbi:MAG: ATP-binding protein [candidate division WOR-3 bacterium]